MFNNKFDKSADYGRQANRNRLREITSAYIGIGRVMSY